jgi:phospholipid-translocating ATPase
MVLNVNEEMEMRKLHMGTMSFDLEAMDELKNQLKSAFDADASRNGLNFKRHLGISGRVRDVVCALSLCHNVYSFHSGYTSSW